MKQIQHLLNSISYLKILSSFPKQGDFTYPYLLYTCHHPLLGQTKSKLLKQSSCVLTLVLSYLLNILSVPGQDHIVTNGVLAVLCLVAQSCPTLCDPIDCRLPGSSVHGDSLGKNIGALSDAYFFL